MAIQEKVIQILKSSPDYTSGQELSRILKITRAAVWKHIKEIQKLGYKITASPNRGYQLLSSADKLFPWEIRSGLKTKCLGQQVAYFDTIPSTMDEAVRLGTEGAPEGLVVCAETQTKGRGRLGRSWVSPKAGGIYVSVLLRPKLSLQEVSKLTLLAAVAVCEAVRAIAVVEARIKWPNDIYIGNKKLAGILTELSAELDQVKFVVVGFGINVNSAQKYLPAGATSLKQETGKRLSRVQILQEILLNLENWYRQVETNGFKEVLTRWKELSLTLNRRVCIVEPNRVVEGKAVDLADNGALVIVDDEGNIINKMSGDVRFVDENK